MPLTLAFIHTSHVLIPLFTEVSRRELPGAEFFHMLDESLLKNTIRSQSLTKATMRRVVAMVQLAHEAGADAVMVTCSSIGPAVRLAAELSDFPVFRIDDAMAEQAVRTGRRIGVAATLRTTLEPTVALLREKALEADREIDVVEALTEGAFQAVVAGDTATHDRLVSESLLRLMSQVDVIVLAQASMARVVASLAAESKRVPILSSPELAVRRVRARLFPEQS